jgi:membrane protein required for colicin V production
MNFVPIDVFFMVLFLIITVRCVFRGFVAEMMAIQAVVGGVILALILSPLVAGYLDELMKPSRWNPIIAFLVVFLLVYLLVKILEKIFASIFDRLNLERLDRALGLFLGMVEGVLVLAVLVYLIDLQPLFDSEKILAGSRVAQWIHLLLPEGPKMVSEGLNTII